MCHKILPKGILIYYFKRIRQKALLFSTFMYLHTLYHGRKYFSRYCLQAFSTAEILKSYVNDCFEINLKKKIKMPKKDEYARFKNYERKIKPPFMIYSHFESILVPEEKKKQSPDDSYTNKYQEHVVCSYSHKSVRVDDKFSKPFKSYLGEDAVTILLIVCSKKINILVMWWENILTKKF